MKNYDKKGNKIDEGPIPVRMPVKYYLGVHLPANFRDWLPIIEEFVENNPRLICIYISEVDFRGFVNANQANKRKPWVLSLKNGIIQIIPHVHVSRGYMWGRI